MENRKWKKAVVQSAVFQLCELIADRRKLSVAKCVEDRCGRVGPAVLVRCVCYPALTCLEIAVAAESAAWTPAGDSTIRAPQSNRAPLEVAAKR